MKTLTLITLMMLGLGGNVFGQAPDTLDVIDSISDLDIGAMDRNDNILVVGGSGLVTAIDATDPWQLTILSQYPLAYNCVDIAFSGKFIAVASFTAGIQVFGFDSSGQISPIGSLAFSQGTATRVAISDSMIFVAGIHNGIYLVRIHDDLSLSLEHSIVRGIHGASDLLVQDSLLYVADGTAGLGIYDIQDPPNAHEIGRLLSTRALSLVKSGAFVYVADYYGGLDIIDVSAPAAPILTSTVSGYCGTVKLCGTILIAGMQGYFSTHSFYDVTDPHNPMLIGSRNASYTDVFCAPEAVYLAFGQTLYSLCPSYFDVNLDWTSVSAFSPLSISSHGDSLIIPTGNHGIRLYDLSSAAAPVEVFACQEQFTVIKSVFDGQYAYCTCGDGYLRVIDVASQGAECVVGSLLIGCGADISISNGIAYVACGEFGIRSIDIQDPADPALLDEHFFPTDSYGLYAEGSYCFVAARNGGLHVLNVIHPWNMVEVANLSGIGQVYDVEVTNGFAYLERGVDGIVIVNVSNPANPTVATSIVRYDPNFYVTSVSINDNLLLLACTSVLMGIDVSNPNLPIVKFELPQIPCADALSIKKTGIVSTTNLGVRAFRINGAISGCGTSAYPVIVDFPNGANELSVFQNNSISWTRRGIASTVSIEVNRQYPFGPWETIAGSTENDGAYDWFVTDPLSDSCRIRICAVQDTFCDVSDGNFSIVSSQGYLVLARSSQANAPLTGWNFGTVECPQSVSQWFRFKNLGSDTCVVFQPLEPATPEFSRNTPCGTFFALAPNQMSACSVRVVFDPASDGVYGDVLRVQTDAVNGVNGFVEFGLSGEQISIPAAPEVVISTVGNNAVLRWSPIVESIGHCQIDPPSYLVFFSEAPGGPFWFHGVTDDTVYTHAGAVQYASAMFYHVYAVQADNGILSTLPDGGDEVRVSEDEVLSSISMRSNLTQTD